MVHTTFLCMFFLFIFIFLFSLCLLFLSLLSPFSCPSFPPPFSLSFRISLSLFVFIISPHFNSFSVCFPSLSPAFLSPCLSNLSFIVFQSFQSKHVTGDSWNLMGAGSLFRGLFPICSASFHSEMRLSHWIQRDCLQTHHTVTPHSTQ